MIKKFNDFIKEEFKGSGFFARPEFVFVYKHQDGVAMCQIDGSHNRHTMIVSTYNDIIIPFIYDIEKSWDDMGSNNKFIKMYLPSLNFVSDEEIKSMRINNIAILCRDIDNSRNHDVIQYIEEIPKIIPSKVIFRNGCIQIIFEKPLDFNFSNMRDSKEANLNLGG